MGENGLMLLAHLVIIIIILANKYDFFFYVEASNIDSQILYNINLH